MSDGIEKQEVPSVTLTLLDTICESIRDSVQSAKHEIVATDQPNIWRIFSACDITATPVTDAGSSAKVSWYAGLDAVIDVSESNALRECLDEVDGRKGIFISLGEGPFGGPTVRSGKFLIPSECDIAHDIAFSFSVEMIEFEKNNPVFEARRLELEVESLPTLSGKIIIASRGAT